MFWNKMNLFFISVLSCFSILIFAADNEINSFSGKQNEEWIQVQTQLTTIKSKVENQQKLVEDLIQKKELAHGKGQVLIIEELKKAHIELIRVVEQYNLINTNFQTKFPEKGGSLGRVYKRIDPSSIETIQNNMTLEGRLQSLNETIAKQYSKKSKKENDQSKKLKTKPSPGKVVDPGPASVVKPRETQVTDQIILQK